MRIKEISAIVYWAVWGIITVMSAFKLEPNTTKVIILMIGLFGFMMSDWYWEYIKAQEVNENGIV